jgi:hypothetical protein
MKEYIKLTSKIDIMGNAINHSINIHSIFFYKDSEYKIYHRAGNKPAVFDMVYAEGSSGYWTYVQYRINGKLIEKK